MTTHKYAVRRLFLNFSKLSPVLCVPDPPSAQGPPQRRRDPSGSQTIQSPPQCKLRPEGVRFWLGPKRQDRGTIRHRDGFHDRMSPRFHSIHLISFQEYVATRWYRAPEIMLTFKQYTKAIDVWSVGCILAEMLSGKPLFPGRDYHHQLTLILDVLGTPTLDEFYAITTRRSRDYIRALPFRKKRPFAQLFPNANPLAVDFLTKTLVISSLYPILLCKSDAKVARLSIRRSG